MCIRELLGRHAKALAIAGLLLANGAAAKAQLLPLPLPLPLPTFPLPTLPFPLPTNATTDKGSLVGQSTNGIRQFLGIPYAAPPVGSRRWKPPAAEGSYIFRDASKFAKHCPQSASPFGQASTDEDCLYLNVFAPASSLSFNQQPAPVMVWFHSGAFQSGESDDYNPIALVKRGFVVVTVNYRLGALGFMAHPALTAESSRHASGNYGFQDQQAALRWVQRNIRNFDGDSKNVTIFGESAGGVSVYAHLASPDSAGLFHRAIAQSGSYFWFYREPKLVEAETSGQAFATAVGCPQQDLACLRAAPVSTLLANQSGSAIAYMPNADGAVLPEGISDALYSGHFNRVPVLHGTTQDEYRLFVALQELQGSPTTAENYPGKLEAQFGYGSGTGNSIATYFWTAEEYGSEALALSAHGTAFVFACPALSIAHYLAKYVPVYAYEFDDPNAPQEVLPPVSFPYGSYHGAEVQYILDAPDGPAPLNTDQQQLAAYMKTYWTQFARTGNPNGGTAPAWPSYQDEPNFDANAVSTHLELTLPTPRPFNQLELVTEHGCHFHGPPYVLGQ